jgi:hypothetical protein
MELNESDPQSPISVFHVHFNIILFLYAGLQQSEMLSLHNIKKTDPLLNGVYLWVSLSLLVYSKEITGQSIYFKKDHGSYTYFLHFSFHFKYHTTIRIYSLRNSGSSSELEHESMFRFQQKFKNFDESCRRYWKLITVFLLWHKYLRIIFYIFLFPFPVARLE